MAWYSKLISQFSRKDASVQVVGFDALKKLIGPNEMEGGYLGQYSKSIYVFACISKIAEKIASVELELYQVLNSRGETKPIAAHPLFDLLYRPNPFQTRSEFWEMMTINLKTTGNAFWYKVRNKGGRPVELWNLRPDLVTVITDPELFVKGYRFSAPNGRQEEFAPEDIIHFKYPDPLTEHLGMSPLRPAQLTIQTDLYASRYQRDFFLNNARPDAIIKNPKATLTRDQKDDIREGWEKRYRGPSNSSKIAILEGGLDFQVVSLTQKEMDYIETKKFNRDDILVAFKVPKPILSIVDDVNRANSETALYVFLSETIVPEMTRIVDKLNEELVGPDFGKELYLDFVDPSPENRTAVVDEYVKGIENNYLLINEVRQKEGLPPLNGGWSFYMPLVMQAVGGLPQGGGKALDTKDVKELIAEVRRNSDVNEKAIAKASEPKLYDFKGNFWLKKRFEIAEELKGMIEETARKARAKVRKAVTRSRKGAVKFVSLLKDPGVRAAYAKMVNGRIDGSTAKLKGASNEFFAGQRDRVLKALDRHKGKAARKAVTATKVFDKTTEDGLAAEFVLPFIEQYLVEAGLEAMSMIAPQEDFQTTKRIEKIIRDRAKEFARQVNSTTLDKLDKTLAEGIEAGDGISQLAGRVEAVYSDFPAWRSELIARTEATVANNEGFLEAFKQSNVATGKEWINAGDDRVRAEHQDGIGVGGEVVAVEENFSNGLPYPAEPNCRCVIGPAFLEQ